MQTTTTTTQPITPDIWVAVGLIKDGSYAVIIFLVLMIFFSRNAVGTFLKEHWELVRSVRDGNNKITESLEKSTKAVERISKNNAILTSILADYFKVNLDNIDKDDV